MRTPRTCVACNLGIPHLPDPERAVGEAHRVLKPGGRYAFTCWTPPARNPFFGLVLGSVQKHGNLSVNLPAGPPLFRFGEVTECEAVLRAAGFRSESVTELPMVWPFATPDDIVPAVVASTARVGPILAMQTPEQLGIIEKAIAEGPRSI